MAGLVPATHAFRRRERRQGGGEVKKLCFWGHCDHAALPGLVSEAARRGWPGQARPGRERLRDRVGSSPPIANALRAGSVAKNKIVCYGFLFAALSGLSQGLGPDDGDEARVNGRAARQESMVGSRSGAVIRFRVSAPQDEVVGSYFLLESLVTH
jgi:hypothetical protein